MSDARVKPRGGLHIPDTRSGTVVKFVNSVSQRLISFFSVYPDLPSIRWRCTISTFTTRFVQRIKYAPEDGNGLLYCFKASTEKRLHAKNGEFVMPFIFAPVNSRRDVFAQLENLLNKDISL